MNLAEQMARPSVQLPPEEGDDVERLEPALPASRTGELQWNVRLGIQLTHPSGHRVDGLLRELRGGTCRSS